MTQGSTLALPLALPLAFTLPSQQRAHAGGHTAKCAIAPPSAATRAAWAREGSPPARSSRSPPTSVTLARAAGLGSRHLGPGPAVGLATGPVRAPGSAPLSKLPLLTPSQWQTPDLGRNRLHAGSPMGPLCTPERVRGSATTTVWTSLVTGATRIRDRVPVGSPCWCHAKPRLVWPALGCPSLSLRHPAHATTGKCRKGTAQESRPSTGLETVPAHVDCGH